MWILDIWQCIFSAAELEIEAVFFVYIFYVWKIVTFNHVCFLGNLKLLFFYSQENCLLISRYA